MKQRPILVLLAGAAALAGSELATAGGCTAPIAIMNMSMGSPGAGGFDLTGTPFAGHGSPGPEIRFWAYGHYAEANSGQESQFDPGFSYLINLSADNKVKGVPENLFSLSQVNWLGPKVAGCILTVPDSERRTVVEMSFVDKAREGSAGHTGYYAIASVPFGSGGYDFDDVRGAGGDKGNIVPVRPIPAPRVLGTSAGPKGMKVVSLELEPAASFSEGGKDAPVKLIKGYRVLFAAGSEPRSSDPATYKPALAASGSGEAAVLAPGKASVEVPASAGWLAVQLVYADPAALLSRATSAHVALAAGAPEAGTTGGGRSRK